jgi:CBS domain-containing protein
MTVRDIAEFEVKACSPDSDLASAAKMMWDGDCGVIPVVNPDGRVVGMLTDRDICIAAATRAAAPPNIQVKDVMSREVASCTADDDVKAAMRVMKDRRIRRMPVLDSHGRLAGILSINDLAMRAESRSGAAISGELFLDTLKGICAHTQQPAAV